MGRAIGRRRLLHGAAAATAAWALRVPALAQVTDAARGAMAGAATAFLATLPDDARRRAVFAFERQGAPQLALRPAPPRGPARSRTMPAPARAAAHELMKASLSAWATARPST